MKILTYTTIFPNEQFPRHGLFVRERIRAVARFCDIRVMAPVPWVPDLAIVPDRYRQCRRIDACETQDGLCVDHPRFTVIPRVFKTADPVLLAAATLRPIRRLRQEFDFELIDAHWACPDGVAAVILANAMRVPVTVTVRGDDINVFAREPGRRQAIRWALNRADSVIALSSDLKDEVAGLGIDRSRIAVIPNGVDPMRFRLAERANVRQKLGLSERGVYLLSIGRLHTSKNFHVLVESVGLLRNEFPEIQLILIGEPDAESDATPLIAESSRRLGIQNRVHLIGARPPDELADWYNASDLFCLATAREGSANVLLEALSCGLPCVATDVGGNREAITGPHVGMLAPPEPVPFSKAIRKALTHEWNRQSIAEQGSQRTWSRVGVECYTHLARVIAPAGNAAAVP